MFVAQLPSPYREVVTLVELEGLTGFLDSQPTSSKATTEATSWMRMGDTLNLDLTPASSRFHTDSYPAVTPGDPNGFAKHLEPGPHSSSKVRSCRSPNPPR